MTIVFILFWIAIVFIAYTYLIFPAIVYLRGLIWPQPYRTAGIQPRVSLIIAAHNEEDVIAAKLDNVLSLDYPEDRLEVLIASDGSDDNTNKIVRNYNNPRIKLLALPRQGKAPALNAAATAATGEILVFSDANSMYAPEAIKALVRPFADPQVGGVAGNQCYLKDNTGLANAGERSYWSFDRKLKQFQGRGGNTISATGAIYAIRRHLFQAVPGGVTDDFFISTGVIAQGYRLVFAADAIAYEPAAASSHKEFERKVRVITRGFRAVQTRAKLLNPFHYGFYALQLFSHKVLRRLVIFPLLILCLTSPFLWSSGPFYQLVNLAQLGLYSSAILGMLLEGRRAGRLKLLTIPYFFCMVNIACLLAALNILRGYRIEVWEPQRA